FATSAIQRRHRRASTRAGGPRKRSCSTHASAAAPRSATESSAARTYTPSPRRSPAKQPNASSTASPSEPEQLQPAKRSTPRSSSLRSHHESSRSRSHSAPAMPGDHLLTVAFPRQPERNPRQRFGLISRFLRLSDLRLLATGCNHGGSIEAPSLV